jgi:hypothetical protein
MTAFLELSFARIGAKELSDISLVPDLLTRGDYLFQISMGVLMV